jgi:hypothetical protein
MTTYTAIPDSDIDPESPGTTTLFTRLRDNPIAITEGASGAPSITYAALSLSNDIVAGDIASGAVGQSEIANSAVGQGELKSASGSVSTNSTTQVNLTLPGGEYGFYPRIYVNGSNVTAHIASTAVNTGAVTNISMNNAIGGVNYSYATQRYVQASPPYDLGDGEIGLFVFLEVDKSGNIISTYSAEDAPWHHNGPTKTQADYYDKNGQGWQVIKDMPKNPSLIDALKSRKKIDKYIDDFTCAEEISIPVTQEIKQADMNLIPHPFMSKQKDSKVIILDPVSTHSLKEMCRHHEFNISKLLHDGKIVFDNSALKRTTPEGVSAHKWRFK